MSERIKQGEEKRMTEKTQLCNGNSLGQMGDFRMIISTHHPVTQSCSNFMHSGEPSMPFNIKLYMQVICNRTLKSQ